MSVRKWVVWTYLVLFISVAHLRTIYVHPWLQSMQTYQAYLFFASIGLNPLPFDPATNNEPLQFNSSNGPLVSECSLENGTENSKKRKRPNLPPGTLNDFLSPQTTLTHTRQALQSLTAFTSLFSAAALFLTFECGRWSPGGPAFWEMFTSNYRLH